MLHHVPGLNILSCTAYLMHELEPPWIEIHHTNRNQSSPLQSKSILASNSNRTLCQRWSSASSRYKAQSSKQPCFGHEYDVIFPFLCVAGTFFKIVASSAHSCDDTCPLEVSPVQELHKPGGIVRKLVFNGQTSEESPTA
jgi:hypothetical protein